MSGVIKTAGEVIELADDRVICWLTVGSIRLRSSLPVAYFREVPCYPGSEFVYLPGRAMVTECSFDGMGELQNELDVLEREWDSDLKHRTPRMAEASE